MTTGFLRAPIMRSNHCWAVLHVSIWAVLLLTLNADSEDSSCEVELLVRRNTVYEAFLGDELRINCTVTFCNDSSPTISWYKLETTTVPVNVSHGSHIKTEWETSNHEAGTSYLIFQNILISDSGVYQCEGGGSVSHRINISVYDKDKPTNVPQMNGTTDGTITDPPPVEEMWMYVYSAAGIVAFVITVIIISVVSMQGCKGKSKKETQADNQYMAIPMGEHPFPQASQQALPPSRRSTRRKPAPSQPSESPSPRDNEELYSKIAGDRERQRNMVEEEGSSVVYAALNHQLPARPPARPWRPKEEYSEYAAIRVKDH